MNTSNFSYSEEALLLNSLHEVVKVWASGKGKADFQLKIKNGTAELQLAFRLGNPSVVHVVPPLPHHDLHHEPQLPRRRHSKGAARREKDRARAEKHQVSLKPEKSAESAEILLPFRRRILPLATDVQVKATPSLVLTSTSTPSTPTRECSTGSAWTPNGAVSASHQTSKPKKPSIPISSPNTLTTI